MFARVSTGQVMGDKVDELVMIFKESIIPTAKSQQGFRGAYLLTNREASKAIVIAFWDKEEDAASEQSAYYQELFKTKYLLTEPPVCEVYEVSAQD